MAPLPDPGSAFSSWLSSASLTGDPGDLARRTIVTPSCGLGAADPAHAEAAFQLAAVVGGLIAQVAEAPTR